MMGLTDCARTFSENRILEVFWRNDPMPAQGAFSFKITVFPYQILFSCLKRTRERGFGVTRTAFCSIQGKI